MRAESGKVKELMSRGHRLLDLALSRGDLRIPGRVAQRAWRFIRTSGTGEPVEPGNLRTMAAVLGMTELCLAAAPRFHRGTEFHPERLGRPELDWNRLGSKLVSATRCAAAQHVCALKKTKGY